MHQFCARLGDAFDAGHQGHRSVLKLSVIIANHNYREFVGAAIASALAVDWPNKEVIVVDDASTDGSKSVIDSFGDAVSSFFPPKSTQLGAHILGFRHSVGDVIILLDADDLLEPSVMREVAKVWRPGISKVQYRMDLIDAAGKPVGSAIPKFLPRADWTKVRKAYLSTGAYTTPPGSGNAYSGAFVSDAYAAAPSSMRWSDDVLLTLAPIWGEVITLHQPLARYRAHSANACLESLSASKLRKRLEQDLDKMELLARTAAQLRLPVGRDLLTGNLGHLQYRLASYLIDPGAHLFPQDTIRSLFANVTCALLRSKQVVPAREAAIIFCWFFACFILPRGCARYLVHWRFAPTQRPAVLKKLLFMLSSP
jgi:glycosyltransferase involved in cell wall biosynthesis